jgi:voltage-gated potassium channel
MIPIFNVPMLFVRAMRDGWRHPQFRSLVALAAVTLASGTLFFSVVEGWSLVDAFYFSATTLTTVGFGDPTPTTTLGKLFTVFYIFVGIGIILTFINAMAEISLVRRSIRPERARRDYEDSHLSDE